MDELVVIASFTTAIEAHLVKTRLESEDIPCLIANEYAVIPYANMLYNVQVKVRSADEERASQILREAEE